MCSSLAHRGPAPSLCLSSTELSQGQPEARELEITRYSLHAREDEVLLPPGCRFRVVGAVPMADGLTIVQLLDIPSKEWILDIFKSAAVPPPSSCVLFHGTTLTAALSMQAAGHLTPSESGFFGPGADWCRIATKWPGPSSH